MFIIMNLTNNGKGYLYNKNLKDMLNEIANGGVVGRVLTSPTVAIGTSSKAKIKTSAFTYLKDGVITSVAGAETAFTATTHDLADGEEAVYVLSLLPSNDSFVVTMGTAVVSDDDSAVVPATPDGNIKLGEVLIATDGAAFDASTTLLDAATVTDTYNSNLDTLGLI